MPSFNSNILPSSSGLRLGSTTQRWGADLTNVTITGSFSAPGTGLVPVAFSTSPIFDGSLGGTFEMSLSGNVGSSSAINLNPGLRYTFIIKQDVIGNRTFVWPLGTSGAMIIDPASQATSVQEFAWDGANLYAISPGISGVNLRPGQVVFTNSGVFTNNTQMNLYVESILNNCNPLTEYQAMEGGLGAVAAIAGCVAVPVGATVHEAVGLLGIANGLSAATNAVGVRGQARGLASNVPVWGGVFVAADGGFSNNEVFGAEIDIVSTNAASQGTGLTFQGTLQPNNLFSAIQIATPTGAPWQQGLSFVPVGGVAAAKYGIDFQQGATPTPTGSAAAILLNPVATGVNQVSQGLSFISNDPSAGQNQANVNETAAGNLNIATTKAGTGLTVNSNPVPQEVGVVDLTAQTAAIGTTTLFAVVTAGQHRLSWNAKVTSAAGTSSTLGPLTIVYTDPDGVAQTLTAGAMVTAGTVSTTATGNTTASVLLGISMLLNCKAGTNITYAMAYASNAANAMNYNLHIRLEAL